MTNPKPAGFIVRLLASLVDSLILFVPHNLFWLYIVSASTNLGTFTYHLVLYLVFFALPWIFIVGMFYAPWFTSKFGGNIGKLLTGLRVTDENGNLLTFRRSLFRYLIGYFFSGLLFGLGFFAIIKDKEKLGWHDKATGSKVVVVQNLWPLSLALLVGLIAANYFILATTINNYKSGQLNQEVQNLLGTGLEEVMPGIPQETETPPFDIDEEPFDLEF